LRRPTYSDRNHTSTSEFLQKEPLKVNFKLASKTDPGPSYHR